MAIKSIVLADGTSTATTHTVAAAAQAFVPGGASNDTGDIAFNSGESGFIQAIFVDGLPAFTERVVQDTTPQLTATIDNGSDNLVYDLRVGSALPEGALITNNGPKTEILVNLG